MARAFESRLLMMGVAYFPPTGTSSMKRLFTALFVAALLLPAPSHAQQEESYDYFHPQREMIQHGQQAIFMCNGLFTSNRTLEQVFDKELRYLRQPVGTSRGGDYVVDWERKAVAIGAAGGTPVMRAAFRQGIGCVILAPDQTFEDISDLPVIDTPPPPGDASTMPWPDLKPSAPMTHSHSPRLRPTKAKRPELSVATARVVVNVRLSAVTVAPEIPLPSSSLTMPRTRPWAKADAAMQVTRPAIRMTRRASGRMVRFIGRLLTWSLTAQSQF